MYILDTHFIFFVGLLMTSHQSSCGRKVPFKRQYGTLDFMDTFGSTNDGHFPLQQAPIYGHECLDDKCSKRRFLTVRFGDNPVVEFANFLAVQSNYNYDDFYIRCPKGMLGMGTICHNGNCLKPQLLCGQVPKKFGETTSKIKTVLPSNSTKSAKCPDSLYVSGLECTTYNCSPPGLRCIELKIDQKPKMKYTLRAIGSRKLESQLFSAGKNGGLSEQMRDPIFKITCQDGLCGTMRLFSAARRSTSLRGSVEKWTGYAGDEGTSLSCPSETVVAQIKCETSICGRIKLGCTRPAKQTKLLFDESDTKFSNVFGSYKFPIGICPDGYYFQNLSCLLFSCSEMVMGCVKISFIQ